jgi:hypothetical protein
MMRALEVFGGIWPTARVNEPHLKMPWKREWLRLRLAHSTITFNNKNVTLTLTNIRP